MKEFGPLRNPRHEKFAQLVWQADAKNYRRALAYIAAGYRAKLDLTRPDKAHSADTSACRLAKTDKVRKRILELGTMAAKRNEITQDDLLSELEQARQSALDNQQASAAVAASMGKAKLLGMIVERKESGKPGDFENMTADELRAFINADLDKRKANADGNDTQH
jgi:hypothetical protein